MYSILHIDLDILFLQYKFEATKLGKYWRLLDAKICLHLQPLYFSLAHLQ